MTLPIQTERLVLRASTVGDLPEGRGYASEAARRVLAHAAETAVRRVCALIVAENARSRHLAAGPGMAIARRIEWSGRTHEEWFGSPHVQWAADLRATMDAPPSDEGT